MTRSSPRFARECGETNTDLDGATVIPKPHAHRHQHREAARACAAPLVAVLLAKTLPVAGFTTKPEIALAQIRWACGAGLPRGVVLMDAGFGGDTELRTSVTALGLHYVAGIQSHTTVWALGTGPRPPKKWSGHGRPPKLMRRDDKHKPASVKELASALPKRAWRTIVWREATAEKLSSRFAKKQFPSMGYWQKRKRLVITHDRAFLPGGPSTSQ